MNERLRTWLTNMPPLADPLEQRQAHLLQVILVGFFVTLMLMFPATFVSASSSVDFVIGLGGTMLCAAMVTSALLLLRHGHYRAAVLLVTLALFVPLTVFFIPSGLTNSRAFFLVFAVPITFVAVFGGRRELILTTAITLGIIIVVGLLEQRDPPLAGFVPFRGSIFAAAVVTAFITLGTIAFLQDRFGQLLRAALAESWARTAELEQLRATLETTVAERTDALQQAQLDLERRVQERTTELAQANEALRAEIAEREAAEQRVATSEARLRALIEQMPARLWTTDPDLRFTSAVGPGIVTFDMYSAQTRRPTLAEYFQNVDPNFSVVVAHRQALAGTPATFEYTWLDRTYQVHVEPLHEQQTIVGTIGVSLDITDRIAMEAVLQEREAWLRTVITHAPLILFAFDRNGIFTLSEGKGLAALGLEPGQAVGYSILQMYSNSEATLEYARRALAGEATYATNTVNNVTLETWLQPICDAQGEVESVIGIAIDVSERTRLEVQLLQAQKMEAIGRLAGGVAHDFNNLLTAIIGYTELLLEEPKDAAASQPDLQQILNAANRAAALTQQLLAFSRKQVLQPEILSLNTIVGEVEPLIRRIIGEDIDLITTLRPEIGQVQADPSQIQQVVMNLVVNARDAMPQGGRLCMETANVELGEADVRRHIDGHPGHFVMLAVSDTGTGMDRATQDQLFEPFFTTKEPGKGTGLGLATVHGIVKQSGGNIYVYSELDHGTTFKIYLPLIEQVEESPKIDVIQPAVEHGTETVLLVEDEEMVRRLAQRVLTQCGYQVLVAGHADEALQIYKQHGVAIDLLITDVVMPGKMRGRDLAEHLAAMQQTLCVLYMSGYTDDIIVHHGVLDEGVNFLQKPFTPDSFARKVRDVLDDHPS